MSDINYSALAGLLGSAFLALPAIRLELKRQRYAEFLRYGEDDERFADLVRRLMLNSLILWNGWDSLFTILGAGLLFISFSIELFF